MELTFFTRGWKDNVDFFVRDILAQKYKRDLGNGKVYWIPYGLKPIQLWMLSFPREELDNVLSKVWPYDTHGIPSSYLWAMQKAMGLKKIPKLMSPDPTIFRQNVQVAGIGIKEDFYDGNSGLENV